MCIIIILFIFLIIILYNEYNKYKNQKENFGNFSPYLGNQFYPYSIFKKNDQRMLEKIRYKWEKPFNCYNEGYYNAEQPCGPPLVPIYSYPTLNFHRNEKPNENVI
jgi:hypothetical protein